MKENEWSPTTMLVLCTYKINPHRVLNNNIKLQQPLNHTQDHSDKRIEEAVTI